MDSRKQWKRLLAIAAEMLGYELTGKWATFLNFRHTGASHIAQRGRDPRHLLALVKMIGDTSVATVNRNYFNLEDDLMQEIIDGGAVPDVEVFAADREPVCADPAPDDDDAPTTSVQPPPRRAREHRSLPLALTLVRPSRPCLAARKCRRSARTLIGASPRSW